MPAAVVAEAAPVVPARMCRRRQQVARRRVRLRPAPHLSLAQRHRQARRPLLAHPAVVVADAAAADRPR